MVKVSVCIPSYNNPELFKRCLGSVLLQDLKDYEIIVSDDSTNTEIKSYVNGLGLTNLKYFHNTPSLGSPENWNNAIKHASGKYIKILHHDDHFTDKTSLGKFMDVFEKDPEVSFVFSWSKIVFKPDNALFIHKQKSGQLKRMNEEIEFLFFRNVIGGPSAVCFKNDPTIIFDKNYKWLVDVEFYIKYLKKHPKFVSIPETLVTVVAGEEGQITDEVTRDRKIVISENLNLFSKIYSERLNRKKALLFFQELYSNYRITSFGQLHKESRVPDNISKFTESVFLDIPKAVLLKKIKKRLLTSRYNKRIFKIERF